MMKICPFSTSFRYYTVPTSPCRCWILSGIILLLQPLPLLQGVCHGRKRRMRTYYVIGHHLPRRCQLKMNSAISWGTSMGEGHEQWFAHIYNTSWKPHNLVLNLIKSIAYTAKLTEHSPNVQPILQWNASSLKIGKCRRISKIIYLTDRRPSNVWNSWKPWSHSKHRYVWGGSEAIDKLAKLVISDQHTLDDDKTVESLKRPCISTIYYPYIH